MRGKGSGATQRARELRRNETDAEGLLWWEVKNRQLNGYKFARQVPIGPYIADFVCRSSKLVVEIDGFQHAENPRDINRTRWINEQGYSVLRFWNHEVLQARRIVLETIVAALERRIEDFGEATGYWPAASSPLRGEVARRSEAPPSR